MKKSSKEAIIISRRINEFLNEYMPLQKTKSEHTIRSYDTALSLYIEFLETEKRVDSSKLNAECFSVTYIEDWLLWLMSKRNCSPVTCNVRLGSLRAFLAFLSEREVSMLHIANAASHVKRKKTQKKKVNGLSREAVNALLESPNVSTKTGRRDIVLLVLMYGTATRIDEILSLKIENLHLNTPKPFVTVIGKGNKVRTLYLLPRVVAYLKKYLQEFHGDSPKSEDYVFYSRNSGGKMSQPAIAKQLKKYAKLAHKVCTDVPETLHAHQIRHAKASHWLEDGMNIVQISFLLGHEQLDTTMKYLDITREEEEKALATLEDEKERNTPKKWKSPSGGLAGFCGVRPAAKKLA